jgi:hypothetical protein
MKNFIIAALVLALILIGGYALYGNKTSVVIIDDGGDNTSMTSTSSDDAMSTTTVDDMSTTTLMDKDNGMTVIGQSVEGRDIVAYHFGDGEKEVLFVGGIHGGYGPNTSLVAYELIDHLTADPTSIPESVTVTVIPALNPDGLRLVTGKDGRFEMSDVATDETIQVAGRFNSNTVDLNRNFACDWQETGTWKSRPVSGGTAEFSEPESAAMRDYVQTHKPVAVVVWYSAGGGVFASNCYNGVLPETTVLTDLYADASGYKAYKSFNFYEVTGDMVNWLAKEKVPAISVLLSDHVNTEWTKNLAGITAVLQHYAQ